jgi:hypothetical protein
MGAKLSLQVSNDTLEGLNVSLNTLKFFHEALERRDVAPCCLEFAGSLV